MFDFNNSTLSYGNKTIIFDQFIIFLKYVNVYGYFIPYKKRYRCFKWEYFVLVFLILLDNIYGIEFSL